MGGTSRDRQRDLRVEGRSRGVSLSHVNGATRSLPTPRTCPWAGSWGHSPSGVWVPLTSWEERWRRQERGRCPAVMTSVMSQQDPPPNSPGEPVIGHDVSFGIRRGRGPERHGNSSGGWPSDRTSSSEQRPLGRRAREGAAARQRDLFGDTGRVGLHGQQRGPRTPGQTSSLESG